nr:MAG TPA: hypothetical protein [Caudoviricetes sp.]
MVCSWGCPEFNDKRLLKPPTRSLNRSGHSNTLRSIKWRFR